ncbi:MAG: hypothetical protein AABW85_03320 [archaeon]
MLGYKSPKEWADIKDPVGECVEKASQKALIMTYRNAMENLAGGCVDVEWKKKGGGKIKTKVILVPFLFEGHLFALHFLY